MAAHLAHLCISAVVIGVSFNEAKPIEESRLQGQHRNVRYLPRDFQNFITSHIKRAPNLEEDSRTIKASLASKTNNHIFRGSARFDTSHRRSKKPVLNEYNFKSLQSTRSADEVGSDSSTLFIDPTDVSVQASAPPGTAPYPPALPQIGTNSELPTDGAYSPSGREGIREVSLPSEPTNQDSTRPQASYFPTGGGGPLPTVGREDTREVSFAPANPPEPVSQDPSRSQAVYSLSGPPFPPAGQEGPREFSFAPANSPESVNQNPTRYQASFSPSGTLGRDETKEVPLVERNPLETQNPEIPLSKISYSPLETLNPAAIGEQTAEGSFIQSNSLGSSSPNRPSEDVSFSAPDPFSLSGKTIDTPGKKLRVFPPGLDDDNRISLRLQDEVVRSPFLPNPDFFAFSTPVEVDALGKFTGRPFSFGVGFNQEGTSIGDATYIVPDELAKDLDFELPESQPPQETFGLTIDDGQSIRSELRKETGEFIESFSSVDGTMRSESGTLVDTPDGGRVMVLKGFYAYKSPEGYTVRVDYTSDQTGYHATPTITKPALAAAKR